MSKKKEPNHLVKSMFISPSFVCFLCRLCQLRQLRVNDLISRTNGLNDILLLLFVVAANMKVSPATHYLLSAGSNQ